MPRLMTEEQRQRAAARTRAYYAAHREERKAKQAAYAANHRDEGRAYDAAYNLAHKEQRAATSHQYHLNHAEQRNAAERQRHRSNPGVKIAAAREWVKNNPEQARNSRAAYYIQNRDRIRAQQKDYITTHPEVAKQAAARRRARKRGAAVVDLTRNQWNAIKALYLYRCVYCGQEPKQLTQDHVRPLSQGGNHTVSNVVPSCRPCNSKKRDRPPLRPVQPALLVPS